MRLGAAQKYDVVTYMSKKTDNFALPGFAALLLALFCGAASAANFSQTDWSGGVAADSGACSVAGGLWLGAECTAADPANQTGLSIYSSRDADLGAAAELSLSPVAGALTETATLDFAAATNLQTHTTYADFAAGTPLLTNARINNGAVGIKPATTAATWEVNSAWDIATGVAYDNATFADLDGDGDLDMLIGNGGGHVEAYRNIGSDESHSWEPYSAWRIDRTFFGDYPSNAYPSLGDIDGDGDVDLIISNGNAIRAIENVGDRNTPLWVARSGWNVIPAVHGVNIRAELADLDGDGTLEVVIGGGWNSALIEVHRYDGVTPWVYTPAWNPPDALGGGAAISEGDLDGDGDPDLLVGSRYQSVLHLVTNSNSGVPATPAWSAQSATAVTAPSQYDLPTLVDIDSDGDLDLFVGSDSSADSLLGYENTSTTYNTAGTYTSSVIDTGSGNAGYTTVAYSAYLPASTTLTIDMRAGETATPGPAWSDWASTSNLASGGDISALGSRRYVQYRVNMSTADTSVTPLLKAITINYTAYPALSSTAVADNRITLAIASRSVAWTANASWNFTQPAGTNPSPALGDLNGDGLIDIFNGINWGNGDSFQPMRNTGSATAPLWTTEEAGWRVGSALIPAATGTWVVALVDIDNDGLLDLYLTTPGKQNLEAHRNTGTSSAPAWARQSGWDIAGPGSGGSTAAQAAFADLDNDGDLDAMVGVTDGRMLGYRNTGTATSPSWSPESLWDGPDLGWTSYPALADLDNDGDYDMIYGRDSTTVFGYENTGSASLPVWGANAAWNTTSPNTYVRPYLADLDDDGDMDLLLGQGAGSVAYGRENTGTTIYDASGTYLSAILDFGFAAYTTLDYSANIRPGTALTVDVRAGTTPVPGTGWTAWQSGVASGGDISALTGKRYFQYRINMSANGTNTLAPELRDITINYTAIPSPRSLIAAPYDTAVAGNHIVSLAWSETLVADSDVQIQLRSAPDSGGAPGAWSAWVGPDGTSASYWNSANTHGGGCSGSGAISCSNIAAGLKDGVDDQWFQYRVTLSAGGAGSPVLSDISVGYAATLPPGITLSRTTGLSTAESATSDSFTVVLDSPPAGDVTVDISSDLPGEASPSPAQLTFTPANWSVAQLVTVTGVDEFVDDGDRSYVILVNPASAADASYDALATRTVSGINIDNDSAGITVTAPGLTTAEADTTSDSFTVVLNSQPTQSVVIGLSSGDASEGSVSPSALTFTAADWSTPRVVTVSAVDDNIDDGDIAYSIVTAAASSNDILYNGMAVADVGVTNLDDDTVGISVNPVGGATTSEAGGAVSFDVVLGSEPTSAVTIAVSSSNTSEGTVSPGLLLFDSSNWNATQRVTVTGADDQLLDGDVSYTVLFAAASSADSSYDGFALADYTLTNTDNDAPAIVVTPTSGLTTSEAGGVASFNVKLASIPTAEVVLSVSSSAPSEGSVSSSAISFVAADWDQAKTIFVSGVDDPINDGDTAYSVTVAPAGGGDPAYNSVAAVNVSLTNLDDEGGSGASNAFTQVNWLDGAPGNEALCLAVSGTWLGSECVAVAPKNRSGWRAYADKEPGVEIVNGGAGLRSLITAKTFRHTSNADFSAAVSAASHTNYNDFASAATLSSTRVNNGAVGLAPTTLAPVWVARPGWDVAVATAAGSGHDAPAFADLDNDGDMDMLVGSWTGDTFAYRNSGTDDSPVWVPVNGWNVMDINANRNYSVPTLGDLDGDGDIDLLIGENGGNLFGYENTGSVSNPIWSPRSDWDLAIGVSRARPALIDLDGDGDLDLLVGMTERYVYAYENSGGSPYWIRRAGWDLPPHTTPPYSAVRYLAYPTAGDLDGDAVTEVVAGWRYGPDLLGYENGSAAVPAWSQNFSGPDVSALGNYPQPRLVDLDSDGDLDLLVGTETRNILYGYENTGTLYSAAGTYTSSVLDSGSHSGLTTLSYTAVLPAATSLTVDVRAGDTATPDGSWTAWQSGVANGGDISALGTRRYLQYRLNMATGDSAVTPLLTGIAFNFIAYPYGDGVVALDNSLTLEILSRSVVWTLEGAWQNSADGGSPDSNNNSPSPALGDMDGDGDLDLLRGDNWSQRLAFYRNDGNNVWSYVSEWDLYCCTGVNNTAPSLADMDGDGDLDVIVGSGSTLWAYENVGDASAPAWGSGTPVAQKVAWNIVKGGIGTTSLDLADLDNDGDIDAMVGDANGTNVVWGFENAGTATTPVWIPNSQWNLYESACSGCSWYGPSPTFADLDGDGDYDLILANKGGDRLPYAYENIGTVTTPIWSRKAAWDPAATGTRAHYELADLDGDGDSDLLIGPSSATIQGYRNTGVTSYAAAGSYTSEVIDLGDHLGLASVAYNATIRPGTALTVELRFGATASPDGSWSGWQSVASGADISAYGTNRYLQYRLNFGADGSNSAAPSFHDITFHYTGVVNEASLISSAYDSGVATTLIDGLSWTESLSPGTDLQIQLRAAPDSGGSPGSWSAWVGPDGSGDSYWNSANTHAGGCVGSAGTISCSTIPALLRNGTGNQWLQYRVTLVSSGTLQPSLADISVAYATAVAGGITVAPTSLSTTEAGLADTFDISLTSVPTADVVIELQSGDLSEGSVSPAVVTIASGTQGPVQVSVTGVDDTINDGDVTYTLYTSVAKSADASFDNRVVDDVTVTNANDDLSSGGVLVSPATAQVTTEAGGQALFSVALATQPTYDVTITVSSSDGSEGLVDTNLLTFTPLNWSTPQVVTISGQDDTLFDQDVSYTIVTSLTASNDPNYAGLDVADIAVVNRDDELADVVFTPASGLTTSESGGSAAFSVALAAQPAASVTFSLSSSDSSEGMVLPFTPLTFTPANWNVPQTATVLGVNDAQVDGDVAFNVVTSTFSSSDSNFNGIDPSDMSVTNSDNESVGITIAPGSSPTNRLTTDENGNTNIFIVKLNSQPSADVFISLSSSDPGEGYVQDTIVLRPDDLTWRGVAVTVTGVNDMVADGDQDYTIITGPVVSDDASYNGIDPDDIYFTNLSNNSTYIAYGQSGANLGRSVAFAGDVDGDGFDDVVFGAPNHDAALANAGRALLYYGNATGALAASPLWDVAGDQLDAFFGHAVAGAGDVNNDGFDDLIVGAWGYDVAGGDEGRVYLYHGSASGLESTPARVLDGSVGGALFGYAVAGAGDLNGDGYDDVAIGAYGEERVYIHYGSASGVGATPGRTLTGDQPGAQFGISVAAAGDVDGDGYDDLLIGADSYDAGEADEGRAYLYLGSAAGLSATPSWSGESDQAAAYYGHALTGLGDINSDGYDDIVVGAYRYDNGHVDEGRLFIYHGSASGPAATPTLTMELNQGWSYFGKSLGRAGDINLDGYADMVVGATGYDNVELDEGRAYLYYGSATGINSAPAFVYESDQVGANMGIAVGGGGDFDNDRYGDIVVGADLFDATTADEGRAYIYRTPPHRPGVTVTPTSALETTEAGGTATFTLVLDAPPAADVVLEAFVGDVSEAEMPAGTLFTFTAANWNRPQSALVRGVDDAIDDGDLPYDVVILARSADANYDAIGVASVSLVNRNDDHSISLSASDLSAAEEGADSAAFTFSRTGPTESALTLSYTVGGTATAAADYAALSGLVTIPAGQSAATVTVTPLDDAVVESAETVTLTLAATGGLLTSGTGSATVTIVDNDAAGISVIPATGLVTSEAGGAASFSVVLNTQPSADVTLTLASDTPAEGLISPSVLLFSAPNWSVPQSVTVVGQDDLVVDGDVAYTVITHAATSADSNYNNLNPVDVALVNSDDDVLPNLSVSATRGRVSESGGVDGLFSISRSGSTATELMVFYTISGTAGSGVDYRSVGGAATIAAGSSRVDIPITPTDDSVVEGEESVILSLDAAATYIVDQPGSATLTIVDDEQNPLPVANFAVDQVVTEGGSVSVMVGLDIAAPVYPVTIPYSVSGTALNPADHDAAGGTLVINAGTSGSITFNVVDDGAGDDGETVIFTMGSPTNGTAGGRSVHTVTITETNVAPRVALDATQLGVSSRLMVGGSGNVTVRATVDDPDAADTHTYDWSATNAALTDIFDGDEATFVFDPTVVVDGFYKIRLTVSDSAGAATTTDLLLHVVATGPILTTADSDGDGTSDSAEAHYDADSDGIPDYLDPDTLAPNELQQLSNGGGSYIMRTEVGLALVLGDVAFAADKDGASVSAAEIGSFGAGEGSAGAASATDAVVNTGGYFDFEITGLKRRGQSVKLVIPQQAPIPAGAVYRKYGPVTGWRDFVVDGKNAVASAPGSAGLCPLPADGAYSAGLTEGHHCIELTIEDGGPNDMDGMANYVIEDPAHVGDLSATPSVAVSASDGAADESGDSATFRFVRTGAVDAPLTVAYAVAGSAVSGVDFSALSGSVVIAAGETAATVTLQPLDDARVEGDETVVVSLLDNGTYLLGGSAATATISDDDVASVFINLAGGLITTEAGGTAGFSVVLTSQPSADVSFSLSSSRVSEGTVSHSSLTFTPANWSVAQVVTVTGQDDLIADGKVNYSVVTSNVVSGDSYYNGLSVADVPVSNLDNDTAAINVTPEAGLVTTEAGGSDSFSVVLNSQPLGNVSIALSSSRVAEGTVAPNSLDFDATNWHVPQVVTVTGTDDGIVDGSVAYRIVTAVAISSDARYSGLDAIDVAVTNLDDDTQPLEEALLPVVDFAVDQSAVEGGRVTVALFVSGEPQAYPITIPYRIGGSALNPDDHDAQNGSVVIETGMGGSISFNVLNDAVADGGETLVFTMGTPVNAKAGGRTTHTVTIVEENVAPRVELSATQLGATTRLVLANGGDVVVSALVDDLNLSDSHRYDWSLSSNSLVDIDDGDDATLVFDPSVLDVGFYKVRLTVSDSGAPAATTEVDMLLEVVVSAPLLFDIDSDGDGLLDSAEAHFDRDLDGIPDYLDSSALAAHELQQSEGGSGAYLLTAETGLTLHLGDIAFAAGGHAARVSADDIANYGGGEGGAGLSGAQDSLPNDGNYFDFEISALTQAGQSVSVVIPLPQPLPEGARYRKYDPATGWADFVVDAKNQLASAAGLSGECPPPGAAAYRPGLSAGDECLQLTLEDGGPNDSGRVVNYRVEGTGVVAVTPAVVPDSPVADRSGRRGGGASLFLLLLSVLVPVWRRCCGVR